jgi:hypothetical protein
LSLNNPQFQCQFCDSGFLLDDRSARLRPCRTRYHPSCFRIGLPFKTRLSKGVGLQCPPGTEQWGHFICEACTVRGVRKRELLRQAQDTVLLMLDRARLVDMAGHWASGTLKTYQSKWRVIRAFETDLDLTCLTHSPVLCPPHGPVIRLMWAQERYSLYPARWQRHAGGERGSVQYPTVRALRSAASHHWILDLLQTTPTGLTLGFKDRPTVVSGCSPTDELAFTFFADGMKRRMGDHAKAAVPLLDQHVRWMNHYWDLQFLAPTTNKVKREACRAAITNLSAWLGWLRAAECFGIRWGDTTLTPPADGPTRGLPLGVGTVGYDLLEQTKSSQARTVDVVLAYTTASQLSLGTWLTRLRTLVGPDNAYDECFVMAHDDGRPWNSHYFRYTHLYPLLAMQRSEGDPYLSKYDESPGNGLIEAFWSFNCYRRGGRTAVSKNREYSIRKATLAEIVEHGRWRISRGSLDMPTAYLEWPISDQVCITFSCM